MAAPQRVPIWIRIGPLARFTALAGHLPGLPTRDVPRLIDTDGVSCMTGL